MPRSLSYVACASVATALTLTTRSRIPNAQPQQLQQFLATPAHATKLRERGILASWFAAREGPVVTTAMDNR